MTGKKDGRATDGRSTELYTRVLVIGFLVNLVWENAQAFLYEGYGGFIEHFWTCLVASVVDALVILLVYLLLSLAYRDLFWPRRNSYARYAVVALIGGALAVGFELWALAKEEWDYAESMPLVLGVGLSPLIQLMVLPVLTYFISLRGIRSPMIG